MVYYFSQIGWRYFSGSFWTEFSLLERQKLSFSAKLGDFKILMGLRINPGNWRWNALATLLASLMDRQALMEFDEFEIFNVDATDKTKTCQDRICPLILLGKF